jgi:erythromycin esterase-like protein
VLDGLAAYVTRLSPAACQGAPNSPVAIDAMLSDVDTAVRLAEDTLAAGDEPTARVMLAAARSTLGSIDERFRLPGGEADRDLLRQADSELRVIELADVPKPAMFESWRKEWPARERQLRLAEPRSLYSEAVLRRFLAH